MSNKSALIVFLKAPMVKKVKTRLAKTIGYNSARNAYIAMVRDLYENLEGTGAEIYYYIDNKEGLKALIPEEHHKKVYLQKGNNIGAKMYNAFKEVFFKGADKAVLIGSDIPQIDYKQINKYLIKINEIPLVLGPSFDGGYYLIGFRNNVLNIKLFKGIIWSSSSVFMQTERIAKKEGFKLFKGKPLTDIDTFSDLLEVIQNSKYKSRLKNIIKLAEQNNWIN